MKILRMAPLAALLVLAAASFASPVSAIDVAPDCAVADLSLTVRPSNDDRMSTDAAFLTLENTSATTCAVPGHPHVSLFDSKGNAIVSGASTDPIAHMHPGPVIVPRNLAPGASLGTKIRWLRVANDPSSATCEKVAIVDLEGAQADLATTICGSDALKAQPHLAVALYASPV